VPIGAPRNPLQNAPRIAWSDVPTDEPIVQLRIHSALPTLPAFTRREPVLVLLAWTVVALVTVVQTLMLVRLEGHADVTGALISRLSIIPLWAIATPLILRSARRFPLAGPTWRTWAPNAALHLGVGTLFILATNAIIRLPVLFAGGPDALATLVHGTALGVAEFYPPAIVVYGVIVGVGTLAARRKIIAEPPAAAADVTVERPVAIEGPAPTPEPCLTVRQWNRVHLVRIDDIDWIEAEDNYIVVNAGGRSYKGRERLGDVEARLDARRFVRIHRSTIVHVRKIREVQPLTHGDHAVILLGGKVLRVARSRRQALEAALAVEL
jgi:hypothetical protein